MSIELVMPSYHLILYHPLLLLPSIFPRIRVFPNESVPRIRWPKYWSFSLSISPSNEYSVLISLGLTGLISLLSNLHFSFVQISQTVVQSGCAILCSHQQCMSDPAALHLHQHLILSLSFILAILKSSNDIFLFYFAFP